MSILSRFNDIIKANIYDLIDKTEDPSGMIDEYMCEMLENLAEVRRDTAMVMAEEVRTKRLLDENQNEIDKLTSYAKKALLAGNEADARVLIIKKQELESAGVGYQKAYTTAHANAEKMRCMHDKLVTDIEALKTRSAAIKNKMALAHTQEKINEISSSVGKAADIQSTFNHMENEADRMLAEAAAMAELNTEPMNEKYARPGNSSIDDELARMKGELGL